jgi:hypothetical protein
LLATPESPRRRGRLLSDSRQLLRGRCFRLWGSIPIRSFTANGQHRPSRMESSWYMPARRPLKRLMASVRTTPSNAYPKRRCGKLIFCSRQSNSVPTRRGSKWPCVREQGSAAVCSRCPQSARDRINVPSARRHRRSLRRFEFILPSFISRTLRQRAWVSVSPGRPGYCRVPAYRTPPPHSPQDLCRLRRA